MSLPVRKYPVNMNINLMTNISNLTYEQVRDRNNELKMLPRKFRILNVEVDNLDVEVIENNNTLNSTTLRTVETIYMMFTSPSFYFTNVSELTNEIPKISKFYKERISIMPPADYLQYFYGNMNNILVKYKMGQLDLNNPATVFNKNRVIVKGIYGNYFGNNGIIKERPEFSFKLFENPV